ncbi:MULTISPECIES: chemotaxis protein CheA [Methylobacterium]|uniref:chemotaxis protein CheA n=1 Tax=Methylobacterium TaxID=407 RepID=UPI0013E9A18B|nr:chemotaxis protein CheA [Methylobacterium sp. DB0501]NGM38998.1 chemotaxis protein CheA [Methylobacterium sp. DB0501]
MTTLNPVDVFRMEADELLACLETTLLDLGEKPQDRALIDTAFRALHTIKGSGAMFGFERVAAFTHDFETAFDLVRQGRVPASVDLVNVALSAKDYIRQLIEDPDGAEPIFGQAILDELGTLVGRATSPAGPASSPDAPEAAGQASSPETAGRGSTLETGWRIGLAFAPEVLRNGTNPLALLDDLRELGPCEVTARLDAVPDLAALDPGALAIGWDVTLRAAVTREAIEDVFLFVQDEMTLTLAALGGAAEAPADPAPPAEPVSAVAAPRAPVVMPVAPPAAPPAAAPPEARAGAQRSASTVRVEAERLDELMDRVGELVIAQARLSQIAGLHADAGIKTVAEEIERLSARLRDTTMSIRMVPIGALFGRFRRLVHDLSRDLGKPVEFVTEGEDTELDKTVIERLADPLVHLIRNAIDHGIEDPARRAGTPTGGAKSATGRITLSAEHVGAQVRVSVRDDGAGLDAARIRAKAEEKGLVAPGTVLSDQQVYQFLFAPGFSTAATISALSGRGVGMDVVKKTIEALRGTIDIATEPGAGTTVTLRLPLTLAIIEGLLIRVGEGRYVVPLSAVEECVELPEGDRTGRGRDFLDIRGALVPFLRLRSLFEADGEPDPYQKVIIVSVGETRVGLVADQIIGNHQTVIKSLSKLHADVATFSGATILGDGTAALIIDVGRLVTGGQAEMPREYQEVA